MAKDCKSKCRICNKAHHTSLYMGSEEKAPSGSGNSSSTLNGAPSSQVMSVVGFNQAATLFQPFVFLKTAKAMAKSRGNQYQVIILVDEGSQRSFITAKMTKQLRLQPVWRESLLLSGLLVKSGDASCYDVTKVNLVGKNGSFITIEAVIIEQLVEPLDDPYRKVVNSLSYLKDLPLAHPSSECSTFSFDILIGGNFFWDLVGDKCIRGSGPTAVNSIFGFLISGPLAGENMSAIDGRVHVNVATVERFDLERFWTMEAIGSQPELENISRGGFLSNALHRISGESFLCSISVEDGSS